MNLKNLFNPPNRTLIIADDGNGVWGIVATSAQLSACNHFPFNTPLETIFRFGQEQGARRVLLLKVADTREIEVKLNRELDPDERRSAILYAANTNSGEADEPQSISYLDGMLHDFQSGILASFFDADRVRDFQASVHAAKMKFLGVTNFKQLLMAAHFSRPELHDHVFLFLLGSHGFLAIPERGHLNVRNLPCGVPSAAELPEWEQRLGRRLVGAKYKSIALYAPEATSDLQDKIKALAEAETVELQNWENALSDAAQFFLGIGQKLLHPALPPPKPKDPHAPGTVLGILFVGLTVLAMFTLFTRNWLTQHHLIQEKEHKTEIINLVKAEKNKLKALETELARQQELFLMMREKQRIAPAYLQVVNLLSRYPLRYTRITAIKEQNNGIFIRGESVWQPDLSNFLNHFEKELGRYNLNLFSDGLTKDKQGTIIFGSHISRGGK